MYAQQGKTVLTKAIGIAILSAICGISATSFAADKQTQQHYEIRSGQLGQALSSFAMQSGVALSFDPNLTNGLYTRGLAGSYRVTEGFEQLLKGTKLQLVQQDHGGWSIEKIKKTSQQPKQIREVGQLKNIAVNGTEKSADASQLPVIKVSAEDQPQGLKKQTQSGVLGNKSILDTPFSITVVESSDIEKRGAKSIGQIFANDASVYTPTNSMSTDWWGTQIRGLGVRNYYVDGIPVYLSWGGDFPVEVAESVTALKGLTGFMYGFGTPGGAISYQTKRPTTTPKSSLQFDYRNSSLFSAYVDNSNHLDSLDLNYRFTLGGDTGTAYNETDNSRFVTSFAFDKQLTDDLTWESNVVYEYNNRKHEPIQFYLDSYDVIGSNGKLPKINYDYDHINIDGSYYKTATLVASTNLKWKINDDWTAKYDFGYTRKKHLSNKIFANLANEQGDYEGNLYSFAGLSQYFLNQLQITGNIQTGSIQHELVAGTGYIRNFDKYSEFFWGDYFKGNIYRKPDYKITHTPNFYLSPESTPESQTYGFLSDTLHFGTQWQAILGVRYTYFDNEAASGSENGYSTKKATPTAALIYKPIPDATIYGSYVEGIERGQRIEAPYANAGEQLDATVSKQYEVGFKYDLDQFSLSSALFKVERVEAMDVIRNSLKYLTQDGLTTYQGWEMNGTYKPSDQLKLGLGLLRLDGEINRVSDENKAIEGNSPAFAAKWQAVSSAEYSFPMVEGLSVHGNVRYNGSSYITNTNQMKVPAYTLVNLGTSYNFKLNKYDAVLNANINNLFNKKYWAGGGYGAGNLGEALNGSLGLKINW